MAKPTKTKADQVGTRETAVQEMLMPGEKGVPEIPTSAGEPEDSAETEVGKGGFPLPS